MPRIVAAIVTLALLLPSGVTAGPILESARRAADRAAPAFVGAGIGQPMGCVAANAAGQEAALHVETSGRWLVGGLVAPVVAPLLATWVSNPSPPAGLVATQDEADLACFRQGYRARGRAQRATAGWVGTSVGLTLYMVAAILRAGEAERPDFGF